MSLSTQGVVRLLLVWRYATVISAVASFKATTITHSSKHGIDEVFHGFWLHKVLTLQNANKKIGNDSQMLFEAGTDGLTIFFILSKTFYHRHSPKGFECLIIQIVHNRDVGIGDNNIWKLLHVTQSVSEPM